jgi:hypothetical protein
MRWTFDLFSTRRSPALRPSWIGRLRARVAHLGSRSPTTIDPDEWSRHMRRDIGLPDEDPAARPTLPSQAPSYWPLR